MTLVVDASVSVKWLVPEPRSEAAERVLSAEDDLIAPDLLLVEVANALWKKTRREEITPAEAAEALDTLRTLRLEILPSAPVLGRALELASQLGHPVYDCVYLALAEMAGARLVADDGPLLMRTRRRRGLPRVIALATFRA